ncbi:hypothetical protein SAMN02799624_05398 [Paenibacillus sp. UNC496MF]|uniref:hypothetical protein n=1 Tax=Paenibacillus sp. UNC496MF TaxID=1502753 RepID=UPI0008E2FB2B|nr:hypothetical protein [Paenibacillus sp. UNC496MF]SFJ65434.1 hypothetical protein SAMN02799624_05398 [Paenibacillus sp. UNC496MF]
MTDIHAAVVTFRSELEKIESPDVRTFTQNVLSATSDSFYNDEQVVTHTKQVFKVLAAFLDKDFTKGMLRDIMLASVLLSDICLNSLEDELKYLHPIVVKEFISQVDMETDLPQPVMEGLIAMIESHEWEQSPSKALEPKPGTPNFLTALANRIVRFDFVAITI